MQSKKISEQNCTKDQKETLSRLIPEWESSVKMLYIHKSIYKFNVISIISIRNLKGIFK